MSWKATAYVKSLKLAPNGDKLKRSEKLFLFVLADSHNEDRRGAWPSATKIASASLLSVRRVREIAKQCRRKGVICYESQSATDGGTSTNLYHFCALDCEHEPMAKVGPEDEPKSGPGGEEISPGGGEKTAGGAGEEISPGGMRDVAGAGCEFSAGGDASPRTFSYIEPPDEPPLEPPHTRPRRRHPVAQAQATLPGVCVGSRFTLEECEAWTAARARQPGSYIKDSSAVAFARFSDGKADAAIAKWLESKSPEKVEEARAAVENNNIPYGAALQRVHSTMAYDQRGPLAIIDELPLAPDVRERLKAKFCQPVMAKDANDGDK